MFLAKLCFSILHERIHAAVCVLVDVMLLTSVIHLYLKQECVHINSAADASPHFIL